MMKISLLWCLVAFVVVCEFGCEVAGRSKGPKRDRRGRGGHHMCAGVMRRSRIDQSHTNCTAYDEVVSSDIAKLYTGKQGEVFQSWIDMLNAMTNREMEADDDDVADEVTFGYDGADDELMMMCKRKYCFKKAMREHIKDGNEIPDFCKVEGRTAEEWKQLRETDRPQQGQHQQPMTVEKYTTIFCAKLHNPGTGRGKGGPGARRGRGRGATGERRKGGRRGGRRGKASDAAQEVPTET